MNRYRFEADRAEMDGEDEAAAQLMADAESAAVALEAAESAAAAGGARHSRLTRDEVGEADVAKVISKVNRCWSRLFRHIAVDQTQPHCTAKPLNKDSGDLRLFQSTVVYGGWCRVYDCYTIGQ